MAYSAMVGRGLWPMFTSSNVEFRKSISPPECVQSNSVATTSRPLRFSNQDQRCHLTNTPRYQQSAPFGFSRLSPRRDIRSVTARSTQTRYFNTSFDPSKSNVPADYNFVQPLIAQTPPSSSEAEVQALDDVVVMDVGPYREFDPAINKTKETYWRGPAPEGSFMIGNKYAQRTRLTPLRVPELGASGPRNPLARILSPFPKEEYYAVEMDHDYGREWPHLVWENGGPVLRPGFLQPFVDPDFAPYWLHRGIARFEISATDRVMQTVVGALYLGVLAAVSSLLYAIKPALFAAVAVSWVRNTLSLAKWALLLGLAAVDKLYLYWVFLAAKLIDGVLARHVPPVRQFCWANFALWCVYLAVTPSDWTLLPGLLG